MANETKPQTTKTETHLRYDIKNPLRARRVIYDGIEGSMKAITIDGGGEKKGVLLHADIVKELKQRNRDKPDSDLILTLAAPEAKDDKAA